MADRIGELPQTLPVAVYGVGGRTPVHPASIPSTTPAKQTVGVDVFFDWGGEEPADLARRLQETNGAGLTLRMISNRGAQVWPENVADGLLVDQWRARFTGDDGAAVDHAQIVALLGRIAATGLDFTKTEHLCTFDGERAYSLAQGE